MVTLPTSSEMSQIEWDAEKTTGAYSGEVAEFDGAVWLKLDVTAGKNYYLYAQSFAYFINEPWVRVYNSSGELITEARYSSLAALTLSPTATGPLYIELQNSSGYPGMMDLAVTEIAATTSFDDDADTADNSYTGTYGERIFGFWEDDSIQIGTGSDASGGRGDDYILGNASANRIWGDHGDDYITAQGGNDLVWGGTGQDQIFGGDGEDQLFGGDDFDQISGGADNDRIFGGVGSDLLSGDAGNDFIDGGLGNDRMRGGAGDDTYIVDKAGDIVTEAANEGTDAVRSFVSYTLAANVENLVQLGASNLNGAGNALANQLTGNTGNNRLDGKAGADTLTGGAGNDALIGGSGADKLYGGSGADAFVFQALSDSNVSTRDMIYDFSRVGGDKIDLSAIDARTTASGNQAFTFIGSDLFSQTAGELRYSKISGDTYIYGDVNGDGGIDFSIRLDAAINMLATDFIL